MGNLVIKNIDKIVSGDFNKGIIEGADTIVCRDGKISQIGKESEVDTSGIDTVVDANQQIAIPGLIDAHLHNTLDDYAPQRQAVGCYGDALLYGTTTMISEGEQGPGWPRFYNDAIGCKAAAILAKRVFDKFRPGGNLKMHGGALVLVDGLTEQDFKEMHEAGVWIIAEIGGGGLSDPEVVKPMVEWARKYGFFVSCHLAPPSIPGSSWVTSEAILDIKPDKIAHFNGGSTGVAFEHIQKLIEESDAGLELVVNGNFVNFNKVLQILKERNELDRVILGSDAPTGQSSLQGAINLAIVKASSLNDIAPEKVIAMATGNTADLYKLNKGKIEVGREADIVIIDHPPGSVGKDALEAIQTGDPFGCSLVVVDGIISGFRGKDGRPVARYCSINGVEERLNSITEHLFFPPYPARHN
ncbi:MAG: hypothetical protein APF76_00595 [Desulfitibacter sp. BRH_c19]|nr:MAG: hypothetical protein APF76_00595 [Desulfitibacter sp. BRH_c19]